MSILIVAEHANQQISPSTLSVLTAAQQLPGDITVLVMGTDCGAVAEQVSTYQGVSNVLLLDKPELQHGLAEDVSTVVMTIASDYQYILAAATTTGKNYLPRIAALNDVAAISDVTGIVDDKTFIRPIYAGNAYATVQTCDDLVVMTVRGTAFDAATEQDNQAPINALDLSISNGKSQFVKQELSESDRPDLTAAKIVISGGRGLQNAENFKLLEQLADRLGAAVGASRAAVDADYVPNDYQVGQTGKIVAPDLYIAIGISGAIQHLAGMKDSKVIVAINKDEDAPIFQIADYGVVGDLFTFLPEFEQALDSHNIKR